MYAKEEKLKQIRDFIIMGIATLVGFGCIVLMGWLIMYSQK